MNKRQQIKRFEELLGKTDILVTYKNGEILASHATLTKQVADQIIKALEGFQSKSIGLKGLHLNTTFAQVKRNFKLPLIVEEFTVCSFGGWTGKPGRTPKEGLALSEPIIDALVNYVGQDGYLNEHNLGWVPDIHEIERLVEDQTCVCCGSLLNTKIDMYDHSDGWNVRHYDKKQWLSKHCGRCNYDMSLNKMANAPARS